MKGREVHTQRCAQSSALNRAEDDFFKKDCCHNRYFMNQIFSMVLLYECKGMEKKSP